MQNAGNLGCKQSEEICCEISKTAIIVPKWLWSFCASWSLLCIFSPAVTPRQDCSRLLQSHKSDAIHADYPVALWLREILQPFPWLQFFRLKLFLLRLNSWILWGERIRYTADSVWGATAHPNWNRRYLQVGCGDMRQFESFQNVLLHSIKTLRWLSTTRDTLAAWARECTLGIHQLRIDFGYRSEHVTALAAKAIATAFGKGPSYSYFQGCSNGGRQALMG